MGRTSRRVVIPKENQPAKPRRSFRCTRCSASFTNYINLMKHGMFEHNLYDLGIWQKQRALMNKKQVRARKPKGLQGAKQEMGRSIGPSSVGKPRARTLKNHFMAQLGLMANKAPSEIVMKPIEFKIPSRPVRFLRRPRARYCPCNC